MNRVNVWGNAESVAAFGQSLEERGHLLFVQLPHKVSRQHKEINGVVDFYNVNADELVLGLRDRGVHALDLRDYAPEKRADYQALFYNTDHHWRAETALWAAGLIAEELNGAFGLSIDHSLYDPANYRVERYERSFLGSFGQKVTLARATPDDFALLYPAFDVDLRLQIPEIDLDAAGGFDIIFDLTPLQVEDPYMRETYGAYLHSAGNQHAFIRLVNNAATEGAKKVLVLGDSFCAVLVPYLALGFRHLDLVDLRHYPDSLQDLISQEGYDLVLLPYASLYEAEHNTGKSMYDFR